MDRKEYWNGEYTLYWKKKIEEANNRNSEIGLEGGDFTSSDSTLFSVLNGFELRNKVKVLDFGCGFCRIYPYFEKLDVNYTGIDISQDMIEEAKSRFPQIVKKLFVSDGENMPFGANTFDLIVCFGVFDACWQESALKEMFRVLNLDGRIILTGKNNLYYKDDDEAYIAEINARKKEHPNYFTDCKKLVEQLEKNHIEIEEQRYFARRGDFSLMKYVSEIPERFYEYLLILRKNKDESFSFEKFSDKFSNTYREKERI